jgi:hypothetical protein
MGGKGRNFRKISLLLSLRDQAREKEWFKYFGSLYWPKE